MKPLRQTLENIASDIIITAYEGGSCGLASWAIDNGSYKWGSEEGDYKLSLAHECPRTRREYASVVLHDRQSCEQVTVHEARQLGDDNVWEDGWGNYYKFGAPLYVDQKIVADFIESFGNGKFDQSNVPEYGRLSDKLVVALTALAVAGYEGGFEELNDALVSDAILQFILLGEVTYG